MDDNEKNDECKDENQKDKGWAWMITAGAALHVFLLVGISKSFGLFFVEFLSNYGTNSSVLSGMLAAQNIVLSLCSLLVLNIGAKMFGNRALIVVGGIVSFVGYILTAFAPNTIILVLSQSVVYGIGCACTTGPVFVVLNSYFERRLGFANSFVYVGGSVGSLVMPTIIQSLLDTYGLNGALLIMSGLILNNVIVGAIMRPFESQSRSESLDDSFDKHEEIPHDDNIRNDGVKDQYSISLDNVSKYYNPMEAKHLNKQWIKLISEDIDLKRSLSDGYRVGYNGNELYQKHHAENKYLPNKYIQNLVDKSGVLTTNETFSSVHSIVSLINNNNRKTTPDSSQSEESTLSLCQKLTELRILQNHSLKLFLFVAFCSFCGSGMIITYIPPFARDQNIESSQVTILVTIVGACDLLARFSLAWITDSKFIRRNHIMGFCLGMTGIATMFNPLYQSFYTFIVYAVFYGLFGSVYFSMSTLLLRDSVGPEKISSALSLMITTHGMSSLTMAPILGLIRDMTGSYTASFYVMGIGLIAGSIAIFCAPCVKRLEDSRQSQLRDSSS